MKKKRGVQRSHDRCKGEGMGGEVANGHMTVGGRGGGRGPVGLPLWARRALYSEPARPVGLAIFGPFGPSPLGLFSPPSGLVRPA